MILTLKELNTLKKGLNELLNQSWNYINSTDITEKEKSITKNNLTDIYSTLSKILELISKEENKIYER